MIKIDEKGLAQKAADALKNAYVPYSHFRVGACVLGESGAYYTGCNIENASYGLTNCAERTAVFNAVSSGERKLMAVAVAGDGDYPMPCGACRQVLSEFCAQETPVIMVNGAMETARFTMRELLPFGFSSEDLQKKEGSV